jgi:hypothetical protein
LKQFLGSMFYCFLLHQTGLVGGVTLRVL